MKISQEQVEHVALLARLELTEAEKNTYTEHLNSILEYAELLNKLDTSGVPPTAHPLPLNNVFREDSVKPSLEQDVALANAPEAENGFFKVPKIL